jgi:hypothetical protein
MIADDVKVSVVDEDLVLLQEELYVLLGGTHEVVQHGEVDVARVGVLQVTHMNRLPLIPNFNIKTYRTASRTYSSSLFIYSHNNTVFSIYMRTYFVQILDIKQEIIFKAFTIFCQILK